MPRHWLSALVVLATSHGALAQNFILKGELTVQSGVEIGIQSFGIGTLDNARSEEISIGSDLSYQKKLRIADYSNTTILFDFPFPEDQKLFSDEPFEYSIGPNTRDDAEFVKNFAFFRPAEYAGIVADRIGNIDRVENCDEFSKLGNRLVELSFVPSGQLTGARSNLVVLSRSSAKLAFKLLFHKCAPAKLDSVSTALTNFTNSDGFDQVDTQNKVRIGTEISFAAVQIADEPADARRTVLNKLLPALQRVVPDVPKMGTVEIGTADLLYAKAQFLRLGGDVGASKTFVRSIIDSGATRPHREIEGSLLYDFFLMISGATKASSEPEYSYEMPLPSNADFDDLTTSEDKSDWCWLKKQYDDRPNLRRLWEQKGVRKTMRQEMSHMKDRSICKRST